MSELTVRKTDVIQPQEWMESKAQLTVIRQTIAPGLTDDEFEVFCGVCRTLRLNPVLRHIYAIKRKDKHSPTGERVCYQMGIDAYRLQAQRSGEYAGSDEPVFLESGNGQFPVRASVTVYRIVKGVRCPFVATALWSEYFPGDSPDSFMWRKMPHGQLAKCAEALALRKAFPAELGGVYADIEMEQADREESVIDAEPIAKPEPIAMPQAVQSPPESEPNGPTADDVAKADAQAALESARDAFGPGDWRQVKIERVETKTGKGRDGRAWTKWGALAGGEWFATFSRGVADDLMAARDGGKPIWLLVEQRGQHTNVVEVRPC